MVVTLQPNKWTTKASINVIRGCRPSIIGRDLMPELGLMLVQAPLEQGMHIKQQEDNTVELE